MAAISSIFLVLSLVLAVLIGPQLRSWTWGPALLPLGIAVLAAVPPLWKRGKMPADLTLVALGIATAGWFAIRAFISPVVEMGQADLLLLAAAVGSFICVRAIQENVAAERILAWGIALLLLASAAVSCMQVFDKAYSPLFRARIVIFPSGFYGHYNEGANFLIGASLLTGAFSIFGNSGVVSRLLLGLIALSGMAMVGFSGSRGGQLGAVAGVCAFTLLAMVVAKRRDSKWFGKLLVALPVVAIVGGAFVYLGWQHRAAGKASLAMLDDDVRLYLMGVAVSCMGLHPWGGGGSRSFAWECYGFWNPKVQGFINAKPELVHNELLQSVTDYGILGGAGLLVLLGAVTLVALLRAGTENRLLAGNAAAWQVGGLAAFAGMFLQSNFSFVFHVVPQAILLGICLGFAVRMPAGATAPPASLASSRLLLSVVGTACAILLVNFGWKGTRVTRVLWPVLFSKIAVTAPEDKIEALTTAIEAWPQSTFYQDRGLIYQELASAMGEGWTKSEEAARALEDYASARKLYPNDPVITINQANLLSSVGRDGEAENAYEQTLRLQGGMENTFLGHYHFATHLLKKGLREFSEGKQPDCVATLKVALEHVGISVDLVPWIGGKLHIAILESLGTALEAGGDKDYMEALALYNRACALANPAHYRAGVLLGKMAVRAWSDRNPSRALALFLEARRRATLSPQVPEDVTPAEKAEYLAYLTRTIAFLEGAKVIPDKLPPELSYTK